jgi:hypothetical protein
VRLRGPAAPSGDNCSHSPLFLLRIGEEPRKKIRLRLDRKELMFILVSIMEGMQSRECHFKELKMTAP